MESRPVAKASAQTRLWFNVYQLLTYLTGTTARATGSMPPTDIAMPAASPPLPEISAASKDLSPGANGVDVQLRGCGYRSSIGTVPSSLLGPLKKQRKKKPSLAAIPSFSELCLATAWFRGRNTLGPFCRSSNRAAVKLCSSTTMIPKFSRPLQLQ